MNGTNDLPLLLAYAGVGCSLLSGAVSLLAVRRHPDFLHFGSFLFLFLSGAASIVAGVWVLLANLSLIDRFALGLPWLDWHLRIDPLSGFFLVLLGTLVVAVRSTAPAIRASSRAARRRSRCRRSAGSPGSSSPAC